jgi:hypothetical protein
MSALTVSVSDVHDDAYYSVGDGYHWSANRSYFGTQGGSDNLRCWLRFRNITIPKGATINSAVITVYGNTSTAGSAYGSVKCIDEDNTADFTTSPLVGGRALTASAGDLTITGTAADQLFTSPNAASVVQSVINRAGWVNGNALGFEIMANPVNQSRYASFRAYELGSNYPSITIDYTKPAGGIVVSQYRRRWS